MQNKKSVRADVLLLGALVLAGAALGLVLQMAGGAGAAVQVRVNGEVVGTYPLSRDAQVEIAGADGGTNLLVIQNGGAHMQSASCPDGLCVGMGEIRKNGQSIVCLPNKVVAEIAAEGKTAEDTVDVIAGGRT